MDAGLQWAFARADAARELASRTDEIDWIVAAESASYFLRTDQKWVARHVEHVIIESDRAAFRRITIDLDLPEPSTAFERRNGRARYCVPVTWLAKDPPTARIDLRDERGNVLPLLTRDENSDISRVALLEGLSRATGAGPSADLEEAVDLCVLEDESLAFFGYGLVRVVSDQEGRTFPDDSERRCLEQSALRLSGNSAIWVLLQGLANQRRVIKFGYGMEFAPNPVVARKRIIRTRTDLLDAEPVELKELGSGRILWAGTARRAAQRLAERLALGALEFRIPVPNVADPASYHIEIEAPPGLEIRRLRLRARLVGGDGQEVTPQTQYEGRTGHLYFRDAESVHALDDDEAKLPAAAGAAPEVPREPITIDARVRISRRGLMNFAVLSSTIIALGLWGYESSVQQASNEHHLDVAAAVLLIVPALLVVFAVRPEEHAWTSRLLAGVRTMVLASGLLAALAAAALIGVSPWKRPVDALEWYAIAASIPASILLVAWIGLWQPGRWWTRRSPTRRQYGIAAFVALVPVLVIAVARWADAAPFTQASVAIPVSAMAVTVLAAWLSLGIARKPATVSVEQRVSAVACLVIAVLELAVVLQNAPSSSEPGLFGFLTVATAVACAGVVIATLRGQSVK